MSTYPTSDIEAAARGQAFEPKPGAQSYPEVRIVDVEAESPADDVGFTPGCVLTAVGGQPIRDIIDWRWLTCDDVIEVSYRDTDGDSGSVELERDLGQDWGFTFDGVVFDGIRQCRNACTFCFMRQLPAGMRPSLSLRDDDYRLSFLSGTFVTLTNVTPKEERRIVDMRISPLRISLHAVDADVRRALIGKHADHGMQVLERLLAAGIEFHAQIVLVPGVNDGEVLKRTLSWVLEQPRITALCVVPLGYTDHQTMFSKSFEDAVSSKRVLDDIAEFQRRALVTRGVPLVYAADEFYLNAYGRDILSSLPDAEFYQGFQMFEDGVGLVRAFVDEWRSAEASGLAARCAKAVDSSGGRVRFCVGEAMEPVLSVLLASSPLQDRIEPLVIRNGFFGGNVNVTGLLCGCDIVQAVAGIPSTDLVCIPRVVFNDDGVTLDDMSVCQMEQAAARRLAVVSCNGKGFLHELVDLLSTAGSVERADSSW